MILSINKLKEISNKVPLNKKYNYEKRMFDSNKTYDLFISHSYLDKEIINALYYTFEACGYTVFIDWKNEELKDRSQISKQVAQKLKKYMANCKGLLYIATENSSNSKWCPWELGFVDGLKERVAILPILNDSLKEYKGQEYLGIYPYVVYAKTERTKEDEFWVHDTDDYNLYSTLGSWLKDGKLSDHN